MSTAVQMRFETQAQTEKAYPRKKLCAFERNGRHFFIACRQGEIFCSEKCRRKDEQDRPT